MSCNEAGKVRTVSVVGVQTSSSETLLLAVKSEVLFLQLYSLAKID